LNNTFCDVANSNCKVAKPDCDIANNNYEIAISNCKIAKLICKVAKLICEITINNCEITFNICDVTINICKIDFKNCDVAINICDVANRNCEIANYFCKMVFVKIWLFGKYCLILTCQIYFIMEKSKQKRTFAEIVNKSRLMIAGLRNNAAEVNRRGIDASFITEYENELQELERLDAEQERLKAELKMKTEAALTKRKQVESKLSEAKKVVKLSLPQAQWVEFGMEDKR